MTAPLRPPTEATRDADADPLALVLAEARRWPTGDDPGHAGGPVGTAPTSTSPPGGPGAHLIGAAAGWTDVGGLPRGTIAVAAGRALAVAALAAARAGSHLEVDADAVVATVLLPLVVAAATGTPAAARPPDPWPTPDGAVCADLGADGDAEAFGRLLDVLGPRPVAAEELAARAQEWRLPVTPYRRRPARAAGGRRREDVGESLGFPSAPPAPPPAARGWPPLAGVTVVDLTVMWSGPLCTALLASLGARVVKVEPDCRPDGTRSSPGGFLHRALNGDKEHVSLDLRRPRERADFFALVAEADLVVDNFSPRVAVNLGVEPEALRAVSPGVLTLSLPAFPPGPQRHWVSYGTGVHALSGLGEVPGPGSGHGGPHFAAPVATYPDPLAGLSATATALDLLNRRDAGRRPCPVEVPLASALAPLRRLASDGSLTTPLDPVLIGRLARRFGAIPPPPFGPPDPARPAGVAPQRAEVRGGGR